MKIQHYIQAHSKTPAWQYSVMQFKFWIYPKLKRHKLLSTYKSAMLRDTFDTFQLPIILFTRQFLKHTEQQVKNNSRCVKFTVHPSNPCHLWSLFCQQQQACLNWPCGQYVSHSSLSAFLWFCMLSNAHLLMPMVTLVKKHAVNSTCNTDSSPTIAHLWW